jgi:hypothetical protein
MTWRPDWLRSSYRQHRFAPRNKAANLDVGHPSIKNLFQVQSHDWAGRGVAGYGFESGTGEGCGVSGVGGAGSFVCVQRIGFEGGGFGAFCGLDGGFDQRGGDALSAVADADVEAGDAPDGEVVYALETRGEVEPGQLGAGSKLAPACGFVAIEGDQARRRTVFYDLVEGGFALPRGLFAVG